MDKTTIVSARPATHRLAANGKLKLAKPSWYTRFEIMLTRPPPISCGVAKALNVQAKAVLTPATTPGIEQGSVTVRHTRIGPAPRLSAAFWHSRAICDTPHASIVTTAGLTVSTYFVTVNDSADGDKVIDQIPHGSALLMPGDNVQLAIGHWSGTNR